MKDKTIFFVLKNYKENQPGAEKAHYYISKYFIENTDYNITIYYKNISQYDLNRLIKNEKIKLININKYFFLKLNYYILKEKPSIFLSWRWEYSFIVGFLTRILKIQNFTFIHGFIFNEIRDRKVYNNLFSLLYKKILLFSAKYFIKNIFVPSNDLKDELISEYGNIVKNKIVLQYNGIPSILYYNKEKLDNNKVLYVGGFNKLKGVYGLINIAYNNPNFEFHIFGNNHTKNSKNIRKIIEEKNILNIHIKGYSNKIEKEFSKYKILLYPSQLDNLPFAIIEALKYGLLILSTNVGELKHLLVNGYNSIIFDGFNYDFNQFKLYDIERIKLNARNTYNNKLTLSVYQDIEKYFMK